MNPAKLDLSLSMLGELGFRQLTVSQGQQLLDAIYDTLELCVGSAVSREMSDDDTAELFRAIEDHLPDSEVREMLGNAVPNYADITYAQYELLLNELRSVKSKVVAN